MHFVQFEYHNVTSSFSSLNMPDNSITMDPLTITMCAVVQVSVLEGALDCWVFLSCLEVLHRIEGCCDPAQLAANCSHTVGLWAYATDKVTTSQLWGTRFI